MSHDRCRIHDPTSVAGLTRLLILHGLASVFAAEKHALRVHVECLIKVAGGNVPDRYPAASILDLETRSTQPIICVEDELTAIPALLTIMSKRPYCLIASATSAATSSSFVVSAFWKLDVPPLFLISSCVAAVPSLRDAGFRSEQSTVAPSLARRSEISRPMPGGCVSCYLSPYGSG